MICDLPQAQGIVGVQQLLLSPGRVPPHAPPQEPQKKQLMKEATSVGHGSRERETYSTLFYWTRYFLIDFMDVPEFHTFPQNYEWELFTLIITKDIGVFFLSPTRGQVGAVGTRPHGTHHPVTTHHPVPHCSHQKGRSETCAPPELWIKPSPQETMKK